MPPLRNNTFVNNITQNERPDPVRIFLVSLLCVCIFISALFYGASFFFSYKSKMALEEITAIEKRLESLPLDNMLALSKKITTLDGIQKSEANIPLFLDIISDSIEKNTYITSMSYANKGKGTIVKIVGTSDSYEEVVKQMDRLKNQSYSNLISKVELISVSATEVEEVRKVLFSLDVTIDSNVRSVLSQIEEKEYDPSKEVKVKKEETINITNIVATSSLPTLPKSTSTQVSPTLLIQPTQPSSTLPVIIKKL